MLSTVEEICVSSGFCSWGPPPLTGVKGKGKGFATNQYRLQEGFTEDVRVKGAVGSAFFYVYGFFSLSGTGSSDML